MTHITPIVGLVCLVLGCLIGLMVGRKNPTVADTVAKDAAAAKQAALDAVNKAKTG